MPLGDRFDTVLAAARAGADWAWTELYHDLAPVILGYLRSRGAHSPEDVAGEVFLQVVRDLHRFDGDESRFRSWVFTIAHHRLIDAGRRRRRRPSDPVTDEALERALPHNEGQEGLERVAEAELLEVLNDLTEDQRTVLLLRLFADLSIDDVAEMLGKRPGAVKALQHRAIGRLRRRLERHPYPAGPLERSPER
ncbi:MAG: sigma-70 family RNA polymerase sigma factor [Actinomycetota bacterium]|nr:sigma-70 family RNA polymerase sigma factor [Actinomycetota bacterium]